MSFKHMNPTSLFRLLLLSLFCFFSTVKAEAGGILSSFSTNSEPKVIVEEVLKIADVQVGGTRPWDIQVHNPAFYSEVLTGGTLALGESYMKGWWDCQALDQFIDHVLRANIQNNIKPTWAMRWGYLKAKLFNLQDKKGSQQSINHHYQLGNNLYKVMLGSTMAYTCGYWKNATTLDQAQIAKFDLIAQKLKLKKGMSVLDIGCGWGGFAKHIAENYGVTVVGVTLSENQAKLARENTKGLPIEIRVQDYRDVTETFDSVVSIGMFEHVGTKNYRQYMEVAYRCLKNGGLSMLHTIGNNTSSVGIDPWIDRYIFPNAHLPSISEIGIATKGLFTMEDWHNFGPDYDKTLMAWDANFKENWKQIEDDYAPPFYRMWDYYLRSCAGIFRAREVQLWQIVFSKNGIIGGYESIR